MAGWRVLSSPDQLLALDAASNERPQLIFKHSVRCSISHVAYARLQACSADLLERMDLHYLDLIAHRELSNAIATSYQVYHQSPQAILIYRGEAVLDQSHYEVQAQELMEQAAQAQAQGSSGLDSSRPGRS